MIELFTQLGLIIASTGLVLWYIRKQARAFHDRLSSTAATRLSQGDIIASAHAASLLAARFPNAYMPVSDFTMNPVNLQALLAKVEAFKPSLIVEIGGGYSTLILASASKAWGGRVLSFDEDAGWLRLCGMHLERAGLTDRVGLHLLDPQTNIRNILDSVEPGCMVDFLVVDGPFDPQKVGARKRETFRFREFLASGATIYLDDANRPLEQELLAQLAISTPAVTVDRRVTATGFAFAT